MIQMRVQAVSTLPDKETQEIWDGFEIQVQPSNL